MIPGELILRSEPLILNPGAAVTRITVYNISDRPIVVGSHLPFHLVNESLRFDRGLAQDKRLDIPAADTLCVWPGQRRDVGLIAIRRKSKSPRSL